MLRDASFRLKHGLTFETRTFADVTRLYKQEIKDEWAAGFRNDMDYQNYCGIIDRYLNPFFGKMKIDQIRLTNIAEYNAWRKVYWLTGPGAAVEMITYSLCTTNLAPFRFHKRLTVDHERMRLCAPH